MEFDTELLSQVVIWSVSMYCSGLYFLWRSENEWARRWYLIIANGIWLYSGVAMLITDQWSWMPILFVSRLALGDLKIYGKNQQLDLFDLQLNAKRCFRRLIRVQEACGMNHPSFDVLNGLFPDINSLSSDQKKDCVLKYKEYIQSCEAEIRQLTRDQIEKVNRPLFVILDEIK